MMAGAGPLAKVKEDLTHAGVTQFGSGWCWLAVKDGRWDRSWRRADARMKTIGHS
jgi:superoxide dismutase